MPPYFQFLTIVAFHTFLSLELDVVMLEVTVLSLLTQLTLLTLLTLPARASSHHLLIPNKPQITTNIPREHHKNTTRTPREHHIISTETQVGIGGRLDSTNVITHPACTGITIIDYDHTEILGALYALCCLLSALSAVCCPLPFAALCSLLLSAVYCSLLSAVGCSLLSLFALCCSLYTTFPAYAYLLHYVIQI
jgi:hypothetical protein